MLVPIQRFLQQNAFLIILSPSDRFFTTCMYHRKCLCSVSKNSFRGLHSHIIEGFPQTDCSWMSLKEANCARVTAPSQSLFCAASVWVFICLIRLLLWVNARPHSSHLCFLILEWMFLCLLRTLLYKNALSHSKHLYFFTPVCMFLCWLRLLLSENILSHSLHAYSFSLVWVFICSVSVLFLVNVLSHSMHGYLFVPKWMYLCWVRLPFLLNVLPHSSQVNFFAWVWMLRWWCRLLWSLSILPHFSHSYVFAPVWRFKWRVRLHFLLKLFPQWSHIKLLTWEWTTVCRARAVFEGKCFPHSSHSNFLPVVWTRVVCCSSSFSQMNSCSQISQRCTVTPLWDSVCWIYLVLLLSISPHSSHSNLLISSIPTGNNCGPSTHSILSLFAQEIIPPESRLSAMAVCSYPPKCCGAVLPRVTHRLWM